MKYRSKPAEVEAMHWWPGTRQRRALDIVEWVRAHGGEARVVRQTIGGPVTEWNIEVQTINGPAYARPGHYVVMGTAVFIATNGPAPDGPAWRVRDFYPCDPKTFERRWEPVEPDTSDGRATRP